MKSGVFVLSVKTAAYAQQIIESDYKMRCIADCIGLYITSIITKFPAQCSKSYGMPATHQENAAIAPFQRPPFKAPVIPYGIAHKAPKPSPNIADNMLQNKGDS